MEQVYDENENDNQNEHNEIDHFSNINRFENETHVIGIAANVRVSLTSLHITIICTIAEGS